MWHIKCSFSISTGTMDTKHSTLVTYLEDLQTIKSNAHLNKSSHEVTWKINTLYFRLHNTLTTKLDKFVTYFDRISPLQSVELYLNLARELKKEVQDGNTWVFINFLLVLFSFFSSTANLNGLAKIILAFFSYFCFNCMYPVWGY